MVHSHACMHLIYVYIRMTRWARHARLSLSCDPVQVVVPTHRHRPLAWAPLNWWISW